MKNTMQIIVKYTSVSFLLWSALNTLIIMFVSYPFILSKVDQAISFRQDFSFFSSGLWFLISLVPGWWLLLGVVASVTLMWKAVLLGVKSPPPPPPEPPKATPL